MRNQRLIILAKEAGLNILQRNRAKRAQTDHGAAGLLRIPTESSLELVRRSNMKEAAASEGKMRVRLGLPLPKYMGQ